MTAPISKDDKVFELLSKSGRQMVCKTLFGDTINPIFDAKLYIKFL